MTQRSCEPISIFDGGENEPPTNERRPPVNLLEELKLVAEDKAARTLPIGERKASEMLEGRAADEIGRLLEIERKYNEIRDREARFAQFYD